MHAPTHTHEALLNYLSLTEEVAQIVNNIWDRHTNDYWPFSPLQMYKKYMSEFALLLYCLKNKIKSHIL